MRLQRPLALFPFSPSCNLLLSICPASYQRECQPVSSFKETGKDYSQTQ